MVSREVRERTIKNLLALRRHKDEIYKRALMLVNENEQAIKAALTSNDPIEKSAAIFLVVGFCAASSEMASGEESGKTKFYAEGLINSVSSGDKDSMKLASRALFYLIQTSKSYAVEVADMTIRKCDEFIEKASSENQRICVLILLHDFALFTPQYFIRKADRYFDYIFKSVRDFRNCRQFATESLHAALTVISQRENRSKSEWFNKCMELANEVRRDDISQAALLTLNELLRVGLAEAEYVRLGMTADQYAVVSKTKSIATANPVQWLMEDVEPPVVESQTAQNMILDRFTEILAIVKHGRNIRGNRVQPILLEIYPRLVAYDDLLRLKKGEGHSQFSINDIILPLIAGGAKYTPNLQCLGLICLHQPEATQDRVDAIMDIIVKLITSLKPARLRKNGIRDTDLAVFKALSLMIRAHPKATEYRIKDLLHQLFAIGFVEITVIDVFHDIVQFQPDLTTHVHNGLLDLLYMTLMGQKRPSPLAPPQAPAEPPNGILVVRREDVPAVCLALKVLGGFDFQRHALRMFIRYLAHGYLHCDQVEVRLTAVECCAHIIRPFVRSYNLVEQKQKPEVFFLIRNILEGLISLAVVDREVEVRLRVLNSFASEDVDFKMHLAQQDVLQTLFMTVYDENPQIQEATVGLLGGLAELNPAHVYPKLRLLIHETIGQLANSKISHLEEQSAKCIAVLAERSPDFVMPYMDSILQALKPHLCYEKRTVGVTVHVLNALSHLAGLGGVDVVNHLHDLFKPLLQHLQDSSSLSRREASLRALGGLCQSTAFVVDVYRMYPDVLEILLKLLKTELNVNMRRLIMKTLGITGAIDPYTYKVYIGTVFSTSSKSLAVSLPTEKESDDPRHDIILWINYEKCTLEQFYPAITIATLLQMMHDDSLTLLHKNIVFALAQILQDLHQTLHDDAQEYVKFVHQVLPKFISLAKGSSQEFRKFYMLQFVELAPLFGVHMKQYMDDILCLISSTWEAHQELNGIVIDLLAQIGKALECDFSPYVVNLCPYLLAVVQMDMSRDKAITKQALRCVIAINPCLDPHLNLILPPIIYVVDNTENTMPEDVRKLALETLVTILGSHSVGERAPVIMQMWLRNIQNIPLHQLLMKILAMIAQQMWSQFVVYCDTVRAQLQRYRVHDVYIVEYYINLNSINSTKGTEILQLIESPKAKDAIREVDATRKRHFSRGNRSENSDARAYRTMTEVMQEGRSKMLVKQLPSAAKAPLKEVNLSLLQHAMNPPTETSVREDWIQWIDNVRLECMLRSPAKSLSFCYNLALDHSPLSKELFHATFMSIWTHLSQESQNALASKLNSVLKTCPFSEPIQAILNLAEFMDHSEKGPLTVSCDVLSDSAAKVQAYAKALRYKELELWRRSVNGIDFDLVPTRASMMDCEQIISYAKKLNLEELALGMFKIVQRSKERATEGAGRWYEKLGQWRPALDCYKVEQVKTPKEELDRTLRLMRCHEQLGEWKELNELGDQYIQRFADYGTDSDAVVRKDRILQIAARGAWAVGNYARMAELTNRVNENTVEGSFLRAVVNVHERKHRNAQLYINKVREIYDSELTAMAAESYERAYGAMMMSQHLTELEECIEYQLHPTRRNKIAVLWSRRLQGIAQDPEHWHKTLIVRQIVLSQNELRPMWIKFAGLCRKRGQPEIAKRVVAKMLNVRETDDLSKISMPLGAPVLALAFCKLLWHDKEHDLKQRAVENLERLANDLQERFATNRQPSQPIARIMSKCYLKLADWTKSLAKSEHMATASANQSPTSTSRHPSISGRVHTPPVPTIERPRQDEPTENIVYFYTRAAQLNPEWHKAWQRLAILYYNLVMNHVTVIPEEEDQLPGPSNVWNEGFGGIAEDFNVHEPLPPLLVDDDASENAGPPSSFTVQTPERESPSREGPFTSSAYMDTESARRLPVAGNDALKTLPSQLFTYAQKAVACHFEALVHSEGSRMEDTLRLLMLWIQYGEHKTVLNTIRVNLNRVSLEIWLEVAPQLIARLDLTNEVGHLVKLLMIDVAKAHPHGLVYPLIAATKAKNGVRNEAARDILLAVRETNPTVVDQSIMLNEELIRCAILWHEMWHESLEDASRMYFQNPNEYNVDDMMAVLRPLYEKLNQEGDTLKEQSFKQTYAKDLDKAMTHCIAFQTSRSKQDITQAWDIYYNVFKKISLQLRTLNAMDLKYVAPKLAEARNLDICIPGTYDPAGPPIKIASIDTELTVIASKQRPRKLTMRGSDDKDYVFLLKGHEDPRQDERVMQLFGLINLLVLRDQDTCRRDLTIQRYTIIPLSQSSGLIGWVPNCDTLHSLIKDYRDKRRIPISAEHSCMQKICGDYEKLTLMQKVEVFRHSMRATRGDDLRETLWMKSPTSEVWFDRRTNYTRSMACMSMVGYILGLGDRHPSNVMLDRLSGKIVHIDFGDCFEVAMNRAKYPELVPFRLTRMLTRAMEVTGLEGNYRITCERILRLIRDHKYSILAVLEAFVYDPVLWFRPADTPKEDRMKLELHIDKQMVDKAKEAIDRVNQKLNGTGFNPMPNDELTIEDQVIRLIDQATLAENLCQCYIGWCPFW